MNITLPPWAIDQLRALQDALTKRDGAAPTLDDLALRALFVGIPLLKEPDDARPLRELSVAEFGRLMGVTDLNATRRLQAQNHEAQMKTGSELLQVFKDVRGLLAVGRIERVTTAERGMQLAEQIQRHLKEQPTVDLVVAIAVAQKEADAYGAPTNLSPVKVTN